MEKKKALHQMQRIKVSDIPQSYEVMIYRGIREITVMVLLLVMVSA